MSFYRVEALTDVWGDPTPAGKRRSRYAFQATFTQSEQLLRRELEFLDPDRDWGATNVVVQVACRPGDLRKDGTLRADARPFTHPGVRISFNTAKHGDLSYGTDVCDLWQHNFRSIALGLEALRAVNRYGISTGQQYVGFKALGAGRAMPASHMTTDAARALLIEHSMEEPSVAMPMPGETERWRLVWRMARGRVHPDRNNGDRTLWDQVEQAAKVLGLLS